MNGWFQWKHTAVNLGSFRIMAGVDKGADEYLKNHKIPELFQVQRAVHFSNQYDQVAGLASSYSCYGVDSAQLFQCLTIALMYNKPDKHVDYLIDCLDQIKSSEGASGGRLAWDKFLPPMPQQSSNGTPLPDVHGKLLPLVNAAAGIKRNPTARRTRKAPATGQCLSRHQTEPHCQTYTVSSCHPCRSSRQTEPHCQTCTVSSCRHAAGSAGAIKRNPTARHKR